MPRATKRHDNEPFEKMLRRFKKAVDNANTIEESRSREFYQKPSLARKKAKAAAKKRWDKKREADQAGRKRLY